MFQICVCHSSKLCFCASISLFSQAFLFVQIPRVGDSPVCTVVERSSDRYFDPGVKQHFGVADSIYPNVQTLTLL